ncbi:quinone-dependent dihydroorotate dehydrogenase [Candidatus Nomurabacteria bacterium]|nr:quinone-dependent dihydroorotate dehydrogenase [Candidatus Nomurabacteria bacterium]
MFYEKIIRPILFLFNPETIHNLTFSLLTIFNKSKSLNHLVFKFCNYTSPRLKQKLFGLYFRNPIGLTAGLDKNAKLSLVWGAFNFGWAQLGSVTYQAQTGNAKPRLWRLVKDKGLLVYYGLSNIGANAVAEKIKKDQAKFKKKGLWSISIAKSNEAALENAAADYEKSFQILEPYAEIITINLSCPNVANFCGLQEASLLEPILAKITEINKNHKPLWLKIGNDLNQKELDDLIYLVKKYKIDAIVATNLAKNRERLTLLSEHKNKPGGVSGQPIAEQANKIIAYLYKNSENKYKIIGVGGVFSGQDAYDKIKAGANLVQIGTGFIYGGPLSVKKINRELDQLLIKNNFKHLNQAVGLEAEKYQLND